MLIDPVGAPAVMERRRHGRRFPGACETGGVRNLQAARYESSAPFSLFPSDSFLSDRRGRNFDAREVSDRVDSLA